MNYTQWAHEYEETANELDKVVTRLKRERKSACDSVKKELADKIVFYRGCRNECIKIANHLMNRQRGIF